MGVPISVIRDDRMLHAVNATSGDLRRICDLFGTKVETAQRYLPNLELDQMSNDERTVQQPFDNAGLT